MTQIVRNTLSLLCQSDFIDRHKTSAKAFSRTRKLPFKTLCLFLLSLVKGSLQDELDAFFQLFNGADYEERFVTKSAISQARKYLSHSAFCELSDHFIQQYYADAEIKRWLGYRLCAVDGSTLRLPDHQELKNYFGGLDSGTGLSTLARTSECYDVLNGITLDFQLEPYKSSERDLAALHLKKTTDRDLMIYDRGYPAFWFFALHRQYQRDFCMRVPVGLFPTIAKFTRSVHKDRVVTLKANKNSKTICRRRGLSFDPIRLRLIKIVLSTGEIEVLVTTLMDKNRFAHALFEDLYHLR